MIPGEVNDSIKEKLERIWTDKTPDHLDPEVKRYWVWLGSIIATIYSLMIIVPIFFMMSPAMCIIHDLHSSSLGPFDVLHEPPL